MKVWLSKMSSEQTAVLGEDSLTVQDGQIASVVGGGNEHPSQDQEGFERLPDQAEQPGGVEGGGLPTQ